MKFNGRLRPFKSRRIGRFFLPAYPMGGRERNFSPLLAKGFPKNLGILLMDPLNIFEDYCGEIYKGIPVFDK
jgi:hypothetical protein